MKTFAQYKQILKYLLVGGGATVTHYCAGLLYHHAFNIEDLLANVFAFITAFIVSFLGQWLWTFDGKGKLKTALPSYLVISLLGFAINQSVVWIMLKVFGVDYHIAMIPALLVVPAITFWLSKTRAFVTKVK